MIYRLMADLVLVTHLAVILFMIFGGFLTWRWPRIAWIHLPSVAYGVAISLVGWVCPLTPVENGLRRAAGDQGYEGGFVEHYILPLVYPPGLTPGVQAAAAVGLVLMMVIAYGVPRLRV